MESRIRLFLLTLALYSPAIVAQQAEPPAATGTATAPPATSGNSSVPSAELQVIQQEPVIQPQIQRRTVKEAQIDSENFEVGIFAGLLSIEDFGTGGVYGARVAYHVTEDFFFEGTFGVSEAGTTSFERLGGGFTLLTPQQRNYTFYTAAVGYNLLPGEVFLGRNVAFNSALYIVGGIGSTDFAGDSRFTAMFGAGFRFILKDWLAIHGNVRDHIFSIDITGEDKNAHNIEMSLGVTYFF